MWISYAGWPCAFDTPTSASQIPKVTRKPGPPWPAVKTLLYSGESSIGPAMVVESKDCFSEGKVNVELKNEIMPGGGGTCL